jgi:hypothetical protein
VILGNVQHAEQLTVLKKESIHARFVVKRCVLLAHSDVKYVVKLFVVNTLVFVHIAARKLVLTASFVLASYSSQLSDVNGASKSSAKIQQNP